LTLTFIGHFERIIYNWSTYSQNIVSMVQATPRSWSDSQEVHELLNMFI